MSLAEQAYPPPPFFSIALSSKIETIGKEVDPSTGVSPLLAEKGKNNYTNDILQ